MKDSRLDLFQKLLEKRVGVRYAPGQRFFMESQLRRRLRELGMDDLDVYLRYLFARGDEEWSILYDRMVIHDSRFFRHAPTFAFIEDVLLPHWRHTHRPVRVWSVGCATGEEPFSLAMTLYASLKERLDIFGNDISLSSLKKAKRGLFPLRKLKDVPLVFKAYLRRAGAGLYQVIPEIRQRVSFFCSNVLHMACIAKETMDLIVCQNLLIYFGHSKRLAILDQLAMRLKQGGSLILAPGEVSGWGHPAMTRIPYPNALAFQKIDRDRLDILHPYGDA